ncbi:MAG: 2-polyprenylphenol 6-hydroxylase [Pseudomonadota bacterium]
MFSAVADWVRLAGAGWRLSRHDALIPHEYAALAPAPIRLLGKVSRVGARLRENGRALRPGERLAAAFEGMGPAYVKLGQFMATRPDVIGFDMARDLGRLQDRMPPFSTAEAKKELARALGAPSETLFGEFSDAIAAASIAQVHKATLPTGESVAVKVLRPRIEEIAGQDFRAFARAARAVEALSRSARRLEPVKFIDTLRESAAVELDLRMEAGAASAISESLKTKEDIICPDVHWSLSARRVLTLSWIDAVPVSNLAALEERGIDKKALARKIMQLFLTQALHEGFFHADMHQGNLMVDDAGRLVLIDFGIMGRLDAKARNTFAQILHGFVLRDYQHTAQAHFDAGYVPAHHSVDAFAQALRSVGEPLFGQNAKSIDMSRVLQQLFDVTELFDMHLRPELVLLQRTMVRVEGVARMLDAEINMWDTATPIVRSYLETEIGPRRQLERLRTAAFKAADIAPHLPDYVEKIARASERISDDRLGLSEQTTSDLAKALSREGRMTRGALWFVGAAMVALAAAIFWGG